MGIDPLKCRYYARGSGIKISREMENCRMRFAARSRRIIPTTTRRDFVFIADLAISRTKSGFVSELSMRLGASQRYPAGCARDAVQALVTGRSKPMSFAVVNTFTSFLVPLTRHKAELQRRRSPPAFSMHSQRAQLQNLALRVYSREADDP